MKAFLLAAATLLLTACEDRTTTRTVYVDQQGNEVAPPTTTVIQPGYQPSSATVIHDHDDNGSSMLTGMALGHMMANSGNNSGGGYNRSKRVKNVTNTYHTTIVQPSRTPTYRSTPSPARSSYKPSSIRSSSSMGSRAVRRR